MNRLDGKRGELIRILCIGRRLSFESNSHFSWKREACAKIGAIFRFLSVLPVNCGKKSEKIDKQKQQEKADTEETLSCG
jgi:hypothetical protein